jgi:hypothetical protein
MCSKAHLRVAWVPDVRGFVPNCDALTTPGGGISVQVAATLRSPDSPPPPSATIDGKKRGGAVGAVHIGGHAVPVMRGALDL